MIPGALAPTNRDFDWVLSMECIWDGQYFPFMRLSVTHSKNVVQRYVFRNGDDKRYFGSNGFLNGSSRLMRRYVYSGGIGLQLLHSLLTAGQDGQPEMLSRLARPHTSNYVGSPF